MEYKVNRIYNMDCVEGMKGMPVRGIFGVDLQYL